MRTGSTLLRERTDQTTRPDPVVRHQRLTDLGLGWRMVALVLLGVTIVLYVLRGALPVTPFSTPGNLQTDYARVFAPQGWAFFTYNPRAPHLTVLGRDATGAWSVLTPGRLAVPADLMGLDRIRQAQDTDVRRLLPQVPDNAWVACEREAVDCLSELGPGPAVTNVSPRRDVCGDIGLIMQEVVPWAWREFPTIMPSKVVRVTVTC
jgi:antimicrobial peptide system SdpA family protein